MFKKKATLIFQSLKNYIWSDELKMQGRMNEKNFIRDRVLNFPILILFLINLIKKTLQVSLNEFCNAVDLLNVTKQAFSKARKKLSFKAFILMNKKLLEEFYSDNIFKTWNGFRLLAVDGGDMQLPQNEELKEKFGTANNQTGTTLAMAKISHAYDVLNCITLDAQIDCLHTSERDLAMAHIEAIKQLKQDPTRDLYLFDRGYPSLGLLFYLVAEKKDFVMRCTLSSLFKRVKTALDRGEKDAVIRLYANEANDDQIKELKKRIPTLDRKNAYIDVRMVIVTLKTGEKEVLLTSLLDQYKYPQSIFGELYAKRWRVEENYKWFKGTLQLENFAGQTELAVLQEFYATVLTANMASLLIQEAQQELDEEQEARSSTKVKLKYNYRINRNVAMPVLRIQLLTGLLDPEIDMDELCESLKFELKKSLSPIRPNRSFKRPRKGALKYGSTTRKSI
jgi:hypothetical protein